MAGILKDLDVQKGGKSYTQRGGDETEEERLAREAKEAEQAEAARLKEAEQAEQAEAARLKAADDMGGGRRRRHSKGHRGNSWLAHVKATMKSNRGKSFKQVLKLAKKSYKKSQSQSGGKGHKGKSRKGQRGGSGGKIDGLSGAPYV